MEKFRYLVWYVDESSVIRKNIFSSKEEIDFKKERYEIERKIARLLNKREVVITAIFDLNKTDEVELL